MSHIVGNFISETVGVEYLTLDVSRGSLPQPDRLRNNRLLANFLADYVMPYLKAEGTFSPEQQIGINDAIKTIVNKLLENAWDFSYTATATPIKITLYILKDKLRFYVTTGIKSNSLEDFQQLLPLSPYETHLGWKFVELEENPAFVTATTMVQLAMLRRTRCNNKMEIKGDNYYVGYDPETVTISCQGSFRLRGSEEYGPIIELLNRIVAENPVLITLDLRQVQFLNSSGISMISKFIIQARKQKIEQVIVHGSAQHPWQGKSLKNLQRLMPGLELKIDP